MNNGSEPRDTPIPDSLSSESERRRWVHKRAQFDSAINSARLLGVVQNLALGRMDANDALRIILEVNSSRDQSQYVAEMLAMKKEFRDLARLDYSPEIAKFILDGSRLVPSLSGGLASQMLMAMGHAAQNDAYIETVSSAVSGLLSDLDHPLMPDSRNYLRLLWDQMEATRRLKQTEALYTIQRPSLVPAERSSRSSASLAAAQPVVPRVEEAPRPAFEMSVPVAAARPAVSVPATRTMLGLGAISPDASPSVEPTPTYQEKRSEPRLEAELKLEAEASPAEAPGAPPEIDVHPPRLVDRVSSEPIAIRPERPSERRSSSRVAIPRAVDAVRESSSKVPVQPERVAERPSTRQLAERRDKIVEVAVSSKLAVEPSTAPIESGENRESTSRVALEQSLSEHEQKFFETAEEHAARELPSSPMKVSEPQPMAPAARAPADTIADEPLFVSPVVPTRAERHTEPKPEQKPDEFKLPTSGVPKWAVASVVTLALAGAGLGLALTSESDKKTEAPSASASGAKAAKGTSSASAVVSAAAATAPSVRKARVQASPSAAGAAPPPPPPPSEPEPTAAPVPRGLRAQERAGIAHTAVAPRGAGAIEPPVRTPPVANNAAATNTTKTPPERVEPATKSPTVITPPEVSKTLSPLDRIIAELRLISPDPVGIEDKARELARIIARSKRKDAASIIVDLGPSIAVDPLGRDPTLEDSLQTFAVSVLGRVATDDDDNRAVDALLLLGEWVKHGGKGKQKALSALQTLSHDSIIKTSAPRLRALKTAQALAD